MRLYGLIADRVSAHSACALQGTGLIATLLAVGCTGSVPPPSATNPTPAALPPGISLLNGEYVSSVDGAALVYVPGGEQDVGSADERDRNPRRKVQVSPFLIDAREVTVGQFRRFVKATGYVTNAEQDGRGAANQESAGDIRGETWSKALLQTSDTDGPDDPLHALLPVVIVDFSDAMAYAKWAGRRLPTGDEWEVAATGGTSRAYPWGDADEEKFRNAFERRDGFMGRAPVGSFPGGASPFGCLDMAGNVAEWCVDAYPIERTLVDAPPIVGPKDSGWKDGQPGRWAHQVRGGGQAHQPEFLRSARISISDSKDRRTDLGFRCCISVSSPPK